MEVFNCSVCNNEVNIELKTKRSGKKCIECFKLKESERHKNYYSTPINKLVHSIKQEEYRKTNKYKEIKKQYIENKKERINEKSREIYKKKNELPPDETELINKNWSEFIIAKPHYNDDKNNSLSSKRKRWIMWSFEYSCCDICKNNFVNSDISIHKKRCQLKKLTSV